MRHITRSAMGRKDSLATRFTAAMLAGVLAFGFTPISQAAAAPADDLQVASAALAAQEGESDTSYTDAGNEYTYEYKDFALVADSYAKGAWTKAPSGDGTYVYKAFAPGDNQHYGTYSLYTEMTVKDKVLTGINLTSGVDSFFGRWGTYSPHTNGWTVAGYLPKGAKFSSKSEEYAAEETGSEASSNALAAQEDTGGEESQDAGGWKVTPTFTPPSGIKDTPWAVYFEAVGSDGKLDTTAYLQTSGNTAGSTGFTAGRGAVLEGKSIWGSVASGDNGIVVTIPKKVPEKAKLEGKNGKNGQTVNEVVADGSNTKDNPTNLIRFVYKVGDYATFSCYAKVQSDSADTGDDSENAVATYLKSLPKTDYSENVPVSDMGTTNRDRWAKTMLSETGQRWIASWSKGLVDPTKTAENDNTKEVYNIDLISGATKTSEPFMDALNAAAEKGYFTSVSDDLALSIDKGSGGYEITRDSYTDKTSAVVNGNGRYEVSLDFLRSAAADNNNEANKRDRSDMEVTGIALYALGNVKVGPQGVMNLQKKTPGYEKVSEIVKPASGNTWGGGSSSSGSGSKASAASDDQTVVFTSNQANEDFSWDAASRKITVTNPAATHVRVTYELGHAPSRHAYSLSDLAAATSINELAAKGSTPSKAELLDVAEKWNAMTTDMHGFVGSKGLALVTTALAAAADEAKPTPTPSEPSKETPKAEQPKETASVQPTTSNATESNTSAVDSSADEGLAAGEKATVGTGAAAAVIKATSDTEVAYVAPANKSAKKVKVPATVTVNGKTYKVTKVNAGAFKGSKAQTVELGKNISKLGKGAFKGAKKLTKVTLKSKKLTTKKSVKGAFKGSKVKTVVLKGMNAKQKKTVKAAILKWGGKKSITVK